MALGLSQTVGQRILIPKTFLPPGDAAECSDVGHQDVHALAGSESLRTLSSSLELRQFRML